MKTVIAVLLATGLPALLGAEELIVRWQEVPNSFIAGRKVKVRLAGDTTLHGKAVAVTPEGLRMVITNIRGGVGKYGRGESIVPAGEISMMKVDRTGSRGRIIGTSIGGGITALATAVVVTANANDAIDSSAPALAGALTPAAVGYFLGWARDRHTVTIHVVQR